MYIYLLGDHVTRLDEQQQPVNVKEDPEHLDREDVPAAAVVRVDRVVEEVRGDDKVDQAADRADENGAAVRAVDVTHYVAEDAVQDYQLLDSVRCAAGSWSWFLFLFLFCFFCVYH